MPPKRASTRTGPKETQATLAFHGASAKVTKSSLRSSQKSTKDILAEPAAKSPKAEPIEVEPVASEPETPEPSTHEVAILKQAEKEVAAQKEKLTPEEEEARKVKESKIKAYWQTKEKERKTPRVHQQGLSLHEKILREFDMSVQYGPCIGIARMKRWKRAHKLGLKPPIEVLAVLLKEQDSNNAMVQRSRVDELLNSHPGEA